MTADSPSSRHTPRLNPFVFPSDTTFRFVPLIVSVLGASLLLSLLLYNTIPAIWEFKTLKQKQCLDSISAAYPTSSGEVDVSKEFFDVSPIQQCSAATAHIEVAWLISSLTLLLGMAGTIYYTFPIWKIRRERLVPLDTEDAPEVAAYLKDLYREAGLSHPPIFLWNPLKLTSSGLAFGRFGRYYVSLNGGLVAQFYANRPAFRAVVLHELAHLRNADVDKTYFSVSIGLAYVVTILVPLAVTLVMFGSSVDSVSQVGWRAFALAALVYLTLTAVLRAREVYADVRASTIGGRTDMLGRLLEALPRSKGDRWLAMIPKHWQPVLQLHPDPNKRRQALDDPRRLFRMGFWEAFGTGIAATIAFDGVMYLLWQLLPPEHDNFLSALGAGLTFAPLIVGVVGLGVWRATFAALARGETPSGAGRLGIALGLGILLGQRFSLTDYAYSQSGMGLTGWSLLAFDVLWSALLLISMFFFVRWIADGASTWLEVAATSDSPRRFYWLGLTVPSVLLALWLGLLFFAVYPIRTTGGPGSEMPLSFSTEYLQSITAPLLLLLLTVKHEIVNSPLTLLALASLWAFPLAAWFWRKRVAAVSEASWAFLDPSPQPLTLRRQPPLRPGLALIVGLVGGLLFCGIMVFIRAALYPALYGNAPNTAETRIEFALAVLIQLVVAAVGAACVKRLRWAHGLCAVFVASCVMAVGALGLFMLEASDTFRYVIIWGTLLSLPVAIGVSAINNTLTTNGNLNPGVSPKVKASGVVVGTIAALSVGTLAFGTEMLPQLSQDTSPPQQTSLQDIVPEQVGIFSLEEINTNPNTLDATEAVESVYQAPDGTRIFFYLWAYPSLDGAQQGRKALANQIQAQGYSPMGVFDVYRQGSLGGTGSVFQSSEDEVATWIDINFFLGSIDSNTTGFPLWSIEAPQGGYALDFYRDYLHRDFLEEPMAKSEPESDSLSSYSGPLKDDIPKQVGNFQVGNFAFQRFEHFPKGFATSPDPNVIDAVKLFYQVSEGVRLEHRLMLYSSPDAATSTLRGAVNLDVNQHGYRVVQDGPVLIGDGKRIGSFVYLTKDSGGADEPKEDKVLWTNGPIILGVWAPPGNYTLDFIRELRLGFSLS